LQVAQLKQILSNLRDYDPFMTGGVTVCENMQRLVAHGDIVVLGATIDGMTKVKITVDDTSKVMYMNECAHPSLLHNGWALG
jgi:hypothetical protein